MVLTWKFCGNYHLPSGATSEGMRQSGGGLVGSGGWN